MCQGHEFKIDLEDDVPPVHRPLYKMGPLELDEARKKIESFLFTILSASADSSSFMGGSDVVHCVRVPLTSTIVA